MMPHRAARHRLSRRAALMGAAGAALAVISAGCGSSASLPAPERVPAVSYPEQGTPPLLVDAAWLLAQPTGSVRVLDASSPAAYRAGHVPGAIHAWWQDTMDPNGPVYGTVLKPDTNRPDPQELRRAYLRLVGVAPGTRVVVYDDAHGRWAARIVWTLRFLGHTDAAVLNGGLAAWRGAGGAVSTAEASAPAVEPAVDPQQGYYLVRGQVIQLQASDPATVLVDIRTDAERRDTFDATIPQGTIPGSVALRWDTLLDGASGTLVSADALRERCASAGIEPDRPVVLYGNFGTETGLPWLALKLLGYPRVLVYDGGWADWARTLPR